MSEKMNFEDDPDNEKENPQGSDKRAPDSEQGVSVDEVGTGDPGANDSETGTTEGVDTGGGMSQGGGSTGEAGGASSGGGTGN